MDYCFQNQLHVYAITVFNTNKLESNAYISIETRVAGIVSMKKSMN